MSDQLAATAENGIGTALPRGRGWRSTRTALHLDPALAYDDWTSLGRRVAIVADSSTWWIGDWLVFGQHAYGNRYRAAIASTGLDYQTLRNYAWVASRFPASRRRDTLSFGHHAEVASLEEDDQEAWLRRSVVEGWSRNELRRRLRAARRGEQLEETDGAGTAAIELIVPPQRRERWEAAASAEGRPLAEWIEDVLDSAADSVLERRSLVAA
jgi:hypothetical protein